MDIPDRPAISPLFDVDHRESRSKTVIWGKSLTADVCS